MENFPQHPGYLVTITGVTINGRNFPAPPLLTSEESIEWAASLVAAYKLEQEAAGTVHLFNAQQEAPEQ